MNFYTSVRTWYPSLYPYMHTLEERLADVAELL
jgi:hypothetical protein